MLNQVDVAQANKVLEVFYERFQHKPLPVFGNDMLRGDGTDDEFIIAAAVIKHRFISKYQKPDHKRRKLLTDACYDQWIDYEGHLRGVTLSDVPLCDRGNLYRARELLHSWFSDTNWKLSSNCDIEFTPGETFVSRKGEVSVFQKLKNKSQWCVTHDAVEDFIRLCYNNLSLKRCAKKHMVQLPRSEHRRMAAMHMHLPHIGYSVFRDRMLNEVLTIVHGSRASTVDKSNEKRRFINVEPLCNVILQRTIAHKIRGVLKTHGNNLDKGQQVHRRRVSDSNISTIDFSNASDSVLWWVCKLLLPADMFKALDRYRSPFVLINGSYHMPVKMSSMGNGFTFELMSALLLALARIFDHEATVYGDDVIIRTASALQFVKEAQHIGFNTNMKKTYIGLPFRESCGAFFMDGYGYITSYDIHYCEDAMDVVTTVNKFYWMKQQGNLPISPLLTEAYDALLDCVPPCCMGPVPSERNNVSIGYAICEGYRRRHMKSTDVVNQWKRVNDDGALVMWCRDHQYKISDLTLVQVMRKRAGVKTIDKPRLVKTPFLLAFYMYTGLVSQDTVRGRDTLECVLHLATPSGLLIPIREVKERFISDQTYLAATVYNAAFMYKFRGPQGL